MTALATRRFRWEGYSSPRHMLRSIAGPPGFSGSNQNGFVRKGAGIFESVSANTGLIATLFSHSPIG